jgi:hypothetical protein
MLLAQALQHDRGEIARLAVGQRQQRGRWFCAFTARPELASRSRWIARLGMTATGSRKSIRACATPPAVA